MTWLSKWRSKETGHFAALETREPVASLLSDTGCHRRQNEDSARIVRAGTGACGDRGLLLVVAVGSNSALFFDRGAQTGSAENRQQTQVSLLVANLTSVGSFGLLGLSKVPVLAAIGSTVAPGAFLALLFAAILTRERVDENAH